MSIWNIDSRANKNKTMIIENAEISELEENILDKEEEIYTLKISSCDKECLNEARRELNKLYNIFLNIMEAFSKIDEEIDEENDKIDYKEFNKENR